MRDQLSFCVVRPAKKAGFFRTEWLRGRVDPADAASEAQALLEDPRDTIDGVYAWSHRHQQFVGTWRARQGGRQS